ncbi:hypothetical protein [Hymenobacter volaticus]|uniref:Uncharacterized protein n=1 Tax=Hymenobacter volaticus TaxID=2932254 RepID=A0ABY4G7N7_9BACT|nr:hypothetical protein [Hymenobacter volaticus]UOQ66806.1 hypothetical protein MUN86_02470 [Hymenobacter volaticus]
MAASTNSARRHVATIIVLLLLLQAGRWLWRTYQHAQEAPQQQATTALQQKIAASHAYDNALLRANKLLDRQDTAVARRLLDSLEQLSTKDLFQIELQKLKTLQQRLDSLQSATASTQR